MKRLIAGIAVLVCLGCGQDEILKPFTADQVGYMLTNGNSKVWNIASYSLSDTPQSLEACTDSLFLWLKVAKDSINTYELRKETGCVAYDTVFYGTLTVGEVNGEFSDSLKFKWGTKSLFLLSGITSKTLTYTENADRYSWVY